ncbi:MAG: sigma-70 family RNA polymerase sigma factor [Actinobacteria bacterium]|nr:sigma-70 family RNA polymerase sigma factor [Actinomycetota bacterium]
MSTAANLARARAGDERAFGALTDPHRRELQVHCYRILGSLQDAEDCLQETLLSAWRGLDGFEGRSSLRSWLYTIATNRCLNALRDGGRRERAMFGGEEISDAPEPTRRAEPIWLQPLPDELVEGLPDDAAGPDARYETKEAVGLAFVSGLQRMPPQQRAVLVLRDVLGYRAAEVAEMLETSEASVNSALQRARAALDAAPERPDGGTVPDSLARRALLEVFAEALEVGDIDTLLGLLREDAWIRMPPEPYEYTGHGPIGDFLRTRPLFREGKRIRLVATTANGQPAFAYYLPDSQADVCRIGGMFVLSLEGEKIAAITRFGEGGWVAHFGLPRTLPGRPD